MRLGCPRIRSAPFFLFPLREKVARRKSVPDEGSFFRGDIPLTRPRYRSGTLSHKGRGSAPRSRLSKHFEIFALFPFRHFGLEAIDFGVLDVNVVVDELGAERLAEEGIA